MKRCYYSETIAGFIEQSPSYILGELVQGGDTIEPGQKAAWLEEIHILKEILGPYREHGNVYFEYSIPRLGKRIDVVAIIESVIFVLEFKVHEEFFTSYGLDQLWDYALDLKSFHETNRTGTLCPRRSVAVYCAVWPRASRVHAFDVRAFVLPKARIPTRRNYASRAS